MEGCLIRANARALFTMSEGPIVRFGSADGVMVGLPKKTRGVCMHIWRTNSKISRIGQL